MHISYVIRNLLDAEETEKVIKEFEDPSTAQILNNNKVQVKFIYRGSVKHSLFMNVHSLCLVLFKLNNFHF